MSTTTGLLRPRDEEDNKKYEPDEESMLAWFIGLAFAIAALVLILVPLFVCALGVCHDEDGQISISSVIEKEPLSTVYAVWGSVFLLLLCYYQIKIVKKGFKVFLAIIGSLFLSVALMIPLGENGIDPLYHEGFAAFGFICEIIFVFCVFLDVVMAPENCSISPRAVQVIYFGTH